MEYPPNYTRYFLEVPPWLCGHGFLAQHEKSLGKVAAFAEKSLEKAALSAEKSLGKVAPFAKKSLEKVDRG